jgi:GNAT superfamily N-acetyltransferase
VDDAYIVKCNIIIKLSILFVQWTCRIQSHFQRGALFYAYHENEQDDAFGIIAVLHEEAPIGIPALGARAEVLDIGVSKDHRRKGIGGILLQHVEKVVKSRGAYCLLMMTYAEDYDVIALLFTVKMALCLSLQSLMYLVRMPKGILS